jgi:hypothetical protein
VKEWHKQTTLKHFHEILVQSFIQDRFERLTGVKHLLLVLDDDIRNADFFCYRDDSLFNRHQLLRKCLSRLSTVVPSEDAKGLLPFQYHNCLNFC